MSHSDYNPPPIPPKIQHAGPSVESHTPDNGASGLRALPYTTPGPGLQAAEAEDYAPPPGPPPSTQFRSGIPPPVPPRLPAVNTPYHISSPSVHSWQQSTQQPRSSSPYQPPLPPRPLNASANASAIHSRAYAGTSRAGPGQGIPSNHDPNYRPQPPQPPRPMSVAGEQVYTPSPSASSSQVPYIAPPPGPPSSSPSGLPAQPLPIESMLGCLSIRSSPHHSSATPQHPSTAQSPSQTPAASSTGGSYHGPREPAPPAVAECIDSESTFPTTWYWHGSAPDFLICSKCYVDCIHGTRFAGTFESGRLADGKTRKCLFNSRRMKDVLYPAALASGLLDPVIKYMRLRPTIQECKGLDGINGGNGHQWYQALDIHGFVSCQACYEECVVGTQLSTHFAPSAEDAQPSDETWACDMAIPYLRHDFKARAQRNDWAGFVEEAKARLAMSACPGLKMSSTYLVPWFVPTNGPKGLVICTACYCDQFLWTTDRSKWREATEWKSETGTSVQCAFGYLNLKLCISRGHELKDLSVFWNAVNKLGDTPMCSANGIKNGEWYTFPSNPSEFGICKACYITVAEPLDISQFLVPKTNIPREQALMCCFNPAYDRFGPTLNKLLETYITRDPSPLESFVSVWASIPRCARDEDKTNQFRYGWLDCMICRECYHNFASGFPSMVSAMELKDKKLPNTTMCEMYSPRMRALFKDCAVSGKPPNLKPLLEYSLHRRSVYMQTVPQIRMIMFQQQMNANQQMMLNTMSTHYMMMGQLDQITHGYGSHTYGAPGVGYGFANMDLVKGEQLKQEAMGVVSGGMGATMQVGMLEQRWRAVE